MKQPTWEQIANQKDVEVGYLVRRCLIAEGKDPDNRDAVVALLADAQEAWRA